MNINHIIGLVSLVVFLLSSRTGLLCIRAYGSPTAGMSTLNCVVGILEWPCIIYAFYWCCTHMSWYIPVGTFVFMMFACGAIVSLALWPLFMKSRLLMDSYIVFTGCYLFFTK